MLRLISGTLLLAVSFIVEAGEAIMTPVKNVVVASNFTLERPDGEVLNLSDFSGKYVLVNFWAHWCSPCIKEFPDMQKLYEQVDKNKFEIIGIHVGPYEQEAAEFVRHFNISFNIVSDPNTSLKGWKVPALPMTYLISPEGKITYQAVGPRAWNIKAVQRLVSTPLH